MLLTQHMVFCHGFVMDFTKTETSTKLLSIFVLYHINGAYSMLYSNGYLLSLIFLCKRSLHSGWSVYNNFFALNKEILFILIECRNK